MRGANFSVFTTIEIVIVWMSWHNVPNRVADFWLQQAMAKKLKMHEPGHEHKNETEYKDKMNIKMIFNIKLYSTKK